MCFMSDTTQFEALYHGINELFALQNECDKNVLLNQYHTAIVFLCSSVADTWK